MVSFLISVHVWCKFVPKVKLLTFMIKKQVYAILQKYLLLLLNKILLLLHLNVNNDVSEPIETEKRIRSLQFINLYSLMICR